MSVPFAKFQGFGNDYIVMLRDSVPAGASLDQLGIDICRRNIGAGADGIAVLTKSDGSAADYYCEIVNPDGSFAGFSGNGTRCAVAYLYHSNLWSESRLRLETRSGVKNYELIERRGPREFWFEAEIGKPAFHSKDVPVVTQTPREAVVNEPIMIEGCHYSFAAVNVGNPVACVFLDDFNFDWRAAGRAMEVHDKFPDRANIVFVKVIDRENIEVRIWERAAGETAASGTCASGAAVLSALMLKTDRSVKVHSAGGTTDVLWRDDDEIVIKGRADYVYSGVWP